MAGSLSGYSQVETYWFTLPSGERFFAKHRYELLDPMSGARAKTFRYYTPATSLDRKPAGADDYLYRLHEVLPAIEAGRTVHWAEGEKDADALAKAGVAATSHHQGAGHVTLEQAAWLRKARRIVLWVDLDRGHWEVGAYDAALRFNRLMEVGVDGGAVRFVRARTGKDAADHLAAGYSPAEAIGVDRYRLAEVASGYQPATARALGYRRGK